MFGDVKCFAGIIHVQRMGLRAAYEQRVIVLRIESIVHCSSFSLPWAGASFSNKVFALGHCFALQKLP
jgi:hypothetical protein